MLVFVREGRNSMPHAVPFHKMQKYVKTMYVTRACNIFIPFFRSVSNGILIFFLLLQVFKIISRCSIRNPQDSESLEFFNFLFSVAKRKERL